MSFFSRLFGKKGEDQDMDEDRPLLGDLSFLGADMHSHFIPGIDDGAQTIEDTLFLLQQMKALGYKTIITTPHTMIDFYPNTTSTITEGMEKVKALIAEHNLGLSFKAASEYYIDDYFMNLLEKQPLLTIYKNEVLVEFSMMFEPPMLKQVLFNMQTNGYRPILAHPERYLFYAQKMDKYQELKDRGCLFQMNLLSLTGYYGKGVAAIAEKLLEKGMYDYCGSDMHHEKHAKALQNLTRSKVYKDIKAYPFLNNRLCF